MALRNIDTSNELKIYRFSAGIKLARPENMRHAQPDSGSTTKLTVGSLMQLPLSVYFINANSINEKVNHVDAELCGFNSVDEAVGKSCFHEFTKESIEITTRNDRLVMQSQELRISEENVILSKSNLNRPTLSFKMPWYNHNNEVIGLFGCSIISGRHPLADSLSLIRSLGILNAAQDVTSISDNITETYLSKRQIQCATLLLAGMTTKDIAMQLNLSPRTIEHYIEMIKSKLECSNKTELIIKLSALINIT